MFRCLRHYLLHFSCSLVHLLLFSLSNRFLSRISSSLTTEHICAWKENRCLQVPFKSNVLWVLRIFLHLSSRIFEREKENDQTQSHLVDQQVRSQTWQHRTRSEEFDLGMLTWSGFYAHRTTLRMTHPNRSSSTASYESFSHSYCLVEWSKRRITWSWRYQLHFELKWKLRSEQYRRQDGLERRLYSSSPSEWRAYIHKFQGKEQSPVYRSRSSWAR